jgi:hypothetical protein
MATIVIKDLPENMDLDHQAMVAITGGSRNRVHPTFLAGTTSSNARIVNYPTNFSRNPLADAKQGANRAKRS